MASGKTHDFHIVDPSPWPMTGAISAMTMLGGSVFWWHDAAWGKWVAAIGLIVRSAIGPVERLLNMLGHQNMCALAYALAFLVNLVLCVLLVWPHGLFGRPFARTV